ncbi:MAG: ABC transporter permease [Nitrospirae bacterium]|nr:ABC transporter permease [Nitrospirota bacterium]
MGRFLIRRILLAVPVFWVVVTITFVLMYAVPGGPFDQEKQLPPAIKANVEARYHLDKPLWQQYFLYLKGIATGDLGPSFKYLHRNVNDILRETLPVSAWLGFWALLVAVVGGMTLGILAGAYAGSWVDRLAVGLATLGIALPSFLLGALFIYLFAHLLRWFPPALWEGWQHLVLPAVALGIGPAAFLARLVRSGMLEVSRMDFVRTARAKGASEARVILVHVLRNALISVVTLLGPLAAAFITGSFVIEYLFSIPGMGRYFVTAVVNRDYPLIMGVTLVYTIFLYAANTLVDLLYTWVDPRVKVE